MRKCASLTKQRAGHETRSGDFQIAMVGTPRATSANSLVCLHKNTDGAARRPYHETSLLHHEQEQELAVTDLRAFDDERTRFAQLRFGLEQQIFLLE